MYNVNRLQLHKFQMHNRPSNKFHYTLQKEIILQMSQQMQNPSLQIVISCKTVILLQILFVLAFFHILWLCLGGYLILLCIVLRFLSLWYNLFFYLCIQQSSSLNVNFVRALWHLSPKYDINTECHMAAPALVYLLLNTSHTDTKREGRKIIHYVQRC